MEVLLETQSMQLIRSDNEMKRAGSISTEKTDYRLGTGGEQAWIQNFPPHTSMHLWICTYVYEVPTSKKFLIHKTQLARSTTPTQAFSIYLEPNW